MKRKLTVTITTVRRQTAFLPAQRLRAHCPVCAREVETFSKAQAADVLAIGDGALEELIAESRVHAIETVSGKQMICQGSLFVRANPP